MGAAARARSKPPCTAHSAVEHDDDVGVMIFADKVQRYVAPARGRRARVPKAAAAEGRLVESDYPAAFRLAARSRKRHYGALHRRGDRPRRRTGGPHGDAAAAPRRRHPGDPALEALAAATPATAGQAFERAAAEELLNAREAALAEMRSRGVMVLDVAPAAASSAVVERYYQLKRRGML
jgi:uncharacterized protein (DUF58 family)